MFRLCSRKRVVSHVSSGGEEVCCVTRFVCSRESMLYNMFRMVLKKAVVSHVSPGAEEGCCVICFVCSQRSMLCHTFRLGLKNMCTLVIYVYTAISFFCSTRCWRLSSCSARTNLRPLRTHAHVSARRNIGHNRLCSTARRLF